MDRIVEMYQSQIDQLVADTRLDTIDDIICEIQVSNLMECEKLIVIGILENLKEQKNE